MKPCKRLQMPLRAGRAPDAGGAADRPRHTRPHGGHRQRQAGWGLLSALFAHSVPVHTHLLNSESKTVNSKP